MHSESGTPGQRQRVKKEPPSPKGDRQTEGPRQPETETMRRERAEIQAQERERKSEQRQSQARRRRPNRRTEAERSQGSPRALSSPSHLPPAALP